MNRAEIEGLIRALDAHAVNASQTHKMMAEAKSKRNQAAGDEWANYGWPTPEETTEGRAAAALRSLLPLVYVGDTEETWKERSNACRNV